MPMPQVLLYQPVFPTDLNHPSPVIMLEVPIVAVPSTLRFALTVRTLADTPTADTLRLK